MGKSFFLSRLAYQLKSSHNRKVLTFNAWESDYCQDPLSAFVTDFSEQIDGPYQDGRKPSKTKKLLKTAGKLTLRHGLPAAIKLATWGLLDSSKILDDVDKEQNLDSILHDTMNELSSQMMLSFAEQKNTVTIFKRQLEEIHRELVSNNEETVFVLIDELDRCRPDYAIGFLEIIKHFFNVKGYVFIIAINRTQLENSINGVYGDKFDSKAYLKRFFDYNLEFPLPKYRDYTRMLFREFAIAETIIEPEILEEAILCASFISEKHEISLRDQENILRLFSVFLKDFIERRLPLDIIPCSVCMLWMDYHLPSNNITFELLQNNINTVEKLTEMFVLFKPSNKEDAKILANVLFAFIKWQDIQLISTHSLLDYNHVRLAELRQTVSSDVHNTDWFNYSIWTCYQKWLTVKDRYHDASDLTIKDQITALINNSKSFFIDFN